MSAKCATEEELNSAPVDEKKEEIVEFFFVEDKTEDRKKLWEKTNKGEINERK